MLMLFSIFSLTSYSQDKITTSSNKILNVSIIEKTDKYIKYKLVESQDYTVFTTKLSNLSKIEYANGDIDLLDYESVRFQKRLGLSTGISLGLVSSDSKFTGNVDYFLSPNFDLELNIGFGGEFSYYSFGTKYFLNKKSKPSNFSPFIGLLFGNEGGYSFIEVPLGLSFISKCGFQTTLQVSGMNYIHYDTQALITELKIGWRW